MIFPLVIQAGTSETISDVEVYAIANRNAPPGASVQIDNGRSHDLGNILKSFHAPAERPFKRVKFTAPVGSNLIVDYATNAESARALKPSSADPRDINGNTSSLMKASDGASVRTVLVDTSGRLYSQARGMDGVTSRDVAVDSSGRLITESPDAVVITSWAPASQVVEVGNRIRFKPGGTTDKVAQTSNDANAIHNVGAYRRVEAVLYARNIVLGGAGNPTVRFFALFGGIAAEILADEGGNARTVAYQMAPALVAGATPVGHRMIWGGHASVDLAVGGVNTYVRPFCPQYVELFLDAGAAAINSWDSLKAALIGYRK